VHIKVLTVSFGFTVLITSSSSLASFGSTNVSETYIARTTRINAEPTKASTLFFDPQTQYAVSDTGANSIRGESVAARGPKDPSKAFLYALIPGSVVHGAGHFYAGKTATGFLLLGTELVGAALVLGGTSTGWGRSSPTREGFAVSLAGEILFLGSWIYDMVKSPLIVQKQNRLLEKNPVGLQFRMKDMKPKLAVVWRF